MHVHAAPVDSIICTVAQFYSSMLEQAASFGSAPLGSGEVISISL